MKVPSRLHGEEYGVPINHGSQTLPAASPLAFVRLPSACVQVVTCKTRRTTMRLLDDIEFSQLPLPWSSIADVTESIWKVVQAHGKLCALDAVCIAPPQILWPAYHTCQPLLRTPSRLELELYVGFLDVELGFFSIFWLTIGFMTFGADYYQQSRSAV
eukprot:3718955-Amphidinium_carterae.1